MRLRGVHGKARRGMVIPFQRIATPPYAPITLQSTSQRDLTHWLGAQATNNFIRTMILDTGKCG